MNRGSLAVSALWLMCAKTLGFALTLALPIVLVRLLTLTEFGLYKQVFLIVSTAIAVLPLGFAMNAFYFLPREPSRKGQVVLNILLFHILIGLLVCLPLIFQPRLLAILFNSPELEALAPLVGTVVLLWVASSIFEIVAVANGEAKLAATFIAVSNFTKALLLLAAAILFTSLPALIIAVLLQGILQMLALLFYLRSRFDLMGNIFDGRLMRSQLAYALPVGFFAALYWLQTDLHHYFVANRFGAAAYAIYSVGCSQIPLFSLLSESIGSVVIGRVSYLQKENKKPEILVLIAAVIRKLSALYFPLYLLLLIFSGELITALFTQQYLESQPIFAIYLTLIPLGIIASAYDPVIRAYPASIYFLISVRVLLLFLLLTSLSFAMEHFRLIGAISVVVGINLIERLIIGFKIARVLEVSRSDLALLKDVGKFAFAAVVAGVGGATTRAAMEGLGPLTIFALGSVTFTVIYVGTAYLLRAWKPDELGAIRGWIGGMRHHELGKTVRDVFQFRA